MLEVLSAQEQLALWKQRATDTAGRVATGIPEFDSLLRRGGLAPTNLVIFAGRTRTRKTTTTLNLIVNILRAKVPVGLVGLDESPASYISKFASAMSGISDEWLEDNWDHVKAQQVREEYEELAENFTMSRGFRPTMDNLTDWREMAALGKPAPQVIFLDYVSLLARDKFAGAENQRIMRLLEEVQVWTNDNEVITVALHQVGRMDEGSGGGRYHGDTPLSLESMKFGGEEIADIVMGTYRPALDPLGQMRWEQAEAYLPQQWKEETKYEAWETAQKRVQKYKSSTFLQLLKNRPGTRTDEEGVELFSVGDSMQMTSGLQRLNDDMTMEETA